MSLISRLHHIFQGTHENEYDGTIMEFEDPEVKKYLVENIGGEDGITNPDFGVEGVKGIAGEVTYEQVLACKKVDFQGNRNIRRFNELEYFKNLSTVNFGNSSIEEVSLPYMTIDYTSKFYGCTKLKKLTTKYGLIITYAYSLFENCTSLQSLDTSRWDFSNLSTGSSMFKDCTSLQSLDTRGWNLSNLIVISSMFENCTSLQSLDTSNWNLHKVRYAGEMLADCTNLVSIDLSDKLENCKNYHEFDRRPPYYIFICHNCPNLETLVGNHTETDNVRLFIGYKGLKTGYSTDTLLNLSDSPRINLATVNAIIRGVGSSPDRKLTLILPEPVKSQVTEEYKKILESKNWEII